VNGKQKIVILSICIYQLKSAPGVTCNVCDKCCNASQRPFSSVESSNSLGIVKHHYAGHRDCSKPRI